MVFGERALDPGAGLAEVMGGIEQAVQFVAGQLGAHPRLFAEHRAQLAALLDGAAAALFHQMVRGFAADTAGQGDAHRLGEHQAVGQAKVAAHPLGVHLQAFEQADRLLQRAGNQATEFRQGFPLGVPETEAALVFLRHRREQGRDQPRRTGGGGDQHRAAHRVALVRHGRGTAAPGAGRLEDLAGLGLHQQADIATELAEATGHQAEHAGEFHQAVALGVPGLFGQSQAQLLGQRRGHRQGLFAERGERPRGAAELQHQQARAQLAQALAVPGQGTEQAGELHAQGHRGGVLQPGAPGQRRVGMPFGLVRQDLGKTLQILLEQGQRTAQLQHQAAVHGVLAGGAEMHVALGLGVASRHLAAQRLDQRDRRVAGSGDRLGQRQRVVQFGAAGRLDRRHRRRGNHPGARLGAGQGGLEVEHALQAAAVGEHRAHRRRREIGIEQLVGGYVAHRFSFSRPVRARRSGS